MKELKRMSSFLTTKLQQLLTGEPRVQSLQLRIKDNVDLAGPSQLPDQLNQPLSLKLELYQVCLNNNWLIAHHLSEIKDAMED